MEPVDGKVYRKVVKAPGHTEGFQQFLTPENQCNWRDEKGIQCQKFRKRDDIYCNDHAAKEKIEKPPLPVTPWDFLKKTKLIKKGKPFSLEEYPFLWTIYQDPHPDKTLMKAAQLGITEYAVILALTLCKEIRGFNVIYTMPAKPDCSSLSKSRIDPFVTENPAIFKDVIQDDEVFETKYDSVMEKQFGNSFFFMKGTWQDAQAISTPADILIHDEIDNSKGDVLGRFASRIGNSDYRFILKFSTPTYVEYGIHKEFLKTDQHHYHYKCESCGHIFKLCCSYPEVIHYRDLEKKNAFFGCPNCHKEISRMSGWWKPDFPDCPRRGYHITKTCSPRVTANQLVSTLVDVYKLERDFWNFELGLPFTGEEDRITMADLESCIDGRYRLMIKDNGCVIGCDVGAEELFPIALKILPEKKFSVVFIDDLKGMNCWKELEIITNQMGIIRGVVDGMPDNYKAREFQNLYGKNKICLNFYNDNIKGKDRITWDLEKGQVLSQRSFNLERMMMLIREKKIIFPQSEKLKPLFQHLRALIRVRDENPMTGETSYSYKNVKQDHFAHSLNYALIAADGLDIKPFTIYNPFSSEALSEEKRRVENGEYSDMVVNHIAQLILMGSISFEDIVKYRCEKRNGKFTSEMEFSVDKEIIFRKLENKFTVKTLLASLIDPRVIQDRADLTKSVTDIGE